MYKAIFFDMGNTLSQPRPSREEVMADFLREKGYGFPVRDTAAAFLAADLFFYDWAQAIPYPQRESLDRRAMWLSYTRTFLESLGLDHNDGWHQEMAQVFEAAARRRHTALFPEVLETLDALKAKGLKLAVVSNWDNTLEEHCRELGLTRYMEVVAASQVVGSDKPDAGIFRYVLEKVGAAPQEALHVGDMYPADVVGARNASITPVLVDRYDLQPQADCLRVRSLWEVVGLVR
jgi:putative hydrolase of the HAD superfamily